MRIRGITSAAALAGAVMIATTLATAPAANADASAVIGPFRLHNGYSGLCAGVGSQTGNGAPVIQWNCNNAADELWYFHETLDNNGNRAYYLKNDHSQKCMGVGSSLANGAAAIQYTCNGATDEKWWLDSADRLRNVYSGKCIGVGSSTAPGAGVIQWTCNNSSDQKWT
ncbi:RICIN domain-containing protein [Streptomyces sp. JNUCC 64]